MINLDITPVTGPDVVGDGYDLPFAAGSFRLVVCDYVIEHVPDPERFLRSLGDVIEAGGVAYLEVPFLQPLHGAPHDYTRWTRAGFRLLADRAGFDVRTVATHAGSGFTVFWILREWFAVLAGLGITSVVNVFRYVLSWLLCPLLIIDLVLPQAFHSEALANGFYVVLTPRSALTQRSA
jgi:SAM-dependent methyltransferase